MFISCRRRNNSLFLSREFKASVITKYLIAQLNQNSKKWLLWKKNSILKQKHNFCVRCKQTMIMSHPRQPHQPFSTPRHLTPLSGRYLGSPVTPSSFNGSLGCSPITPNTSSSSSSGIDSSFSSDSGKEFGLSPPASSSTPTTTSTSEKTMAAAAAAAAARDHPPSRTSQYKKVNKREYVHLG